MRPTQAIFDQSGSARLTQNFLKDFSKAIRAQPGPKLRQQAWFRQRRLRRQIEKEAKGDIHLRLSDDALIRQAVVKLQEIYFE